MTLPFSILAHRANLDGPNRQTENSLAQCRTALELGFGLETDLRRDAQGRFYIAHDPQPHTEANDFAPFARLFRRWPDRVIAMNVKELGYEESLIALYHSGQLGNAAFFFDFELLEPGRPGSAQRQSRRLAGWGSGIHSHGSTAQ